MPKTRRYPPEDPPPPPTGGLLRLIQDDPLIWLFSIDLPTTPPTKARLAAYKETVYFETDSLGAQIPYAPCAISLGEVRADTEGSNPTTKLVVQNVTRELVALVEAYGGLTGQVVRATLIQLSELPSGNPIIDDKYDVLDCDTDEKTVQLSLGRAALAQKQFPDMRIVRDHCGSDYGGIECGYDTNVAAALTTCSKLKIGPNGCTAHGDAEVFAGLTRQHPARFLGFLGVPRSGGTGA